MKYLLELLWLVVPRETAIGDSADGVQDRNDDNNAGADAGSPDPGDPAGVAAPQGGSDPEGKPDWLPDKFWNPEIKAPRTEILAKSFNELEGKLRTKTDDLKNEIYAELRASAPEKYEINLAEDVLPANVEFDFNEEDPLVSWFSEFAREKGLTQDEFDAAINKYVSIEVSALPDVNKEIEKLGDHGQDRLLRVHNWLDKRLSQDQFTALAPTLTSAAQIEALEALMKTTGPAQFDGDNQASPLTLEELRTMQNDPRYWRDKDPAFIKKVEAGYKRLYKDQ